MRVPGRWVRGPGQEFFHAVRAALPGARIIAEDLGYIGPDVVQLRRDAGLPGMKIVQFAYGHDANNANLPHFYPPESVAYTGTHDNITARGWLESLQAALRSQGRGLFSAQWQQVRVADHPCDLRHGFAPRGHSDAGPARLACGCDAEPARHHRGQLAVALHRGRARRAAPGKTGTLRHWISLYDRTGDQPVKDFSEPPA